MLILIHFKPRDFLKGVFYLGHYFYEFEFIAGKGIK